MFSEFFIRRPVFACVISIFTVIMGLVALKVLPIARYPEIAPPTISITAAYPGADAMTVSDTVAAPIESEVNGVENMLYMSSVCANDGSMTLTVTFEPGTDLDIANVLVQNRVAIAEARLPEEVKRRGVTVKKKSTDTVLFIGLTSPNGTHSDAVLSNYANINLRDELARVKGVGDVIVYGVGQLSMRIWLDVDLLSERGLAPSDVVAAIREQNVQVAAGRIGSAPVPEGTPAPALEYIVSTPGRLVTVEEFEQIVVRTGDDGQLLRVKDVAKVEEGSESYTFASRLNGKASATLAIYQIPGTNLMEVADNVKNTLKKLKGGFYPDMEATVVYDSTDVVNASVKEVIITLFATLILVVLTVYVFLQNFRATIVPAVTIPVSLIGTFAVMLALGFSINQLTLFGLVLVIGIVVDDAIVVVENVVRYISEGKSPQEAAILSMREVSGPVVATTLVLLAVFVPTIFIPGISGTLFKQFAVTISIATVFSSINALTLSPALCALLLRKPKHEPRGVFKLFNKLVDATTSGTSVAVRAMVRRSAIGIILFAGIIALAVMGYARLPSGFVPQEDEGYCMVNVQLPDGASLDRTNKVLARATTAIQGISGVENVLAISGYSIIDGAASPNAGMIVVVFKDWSERPEPGEHQSAIIASMNQSLAGIGEGIAMGFPIPSLPGLGVSAGFTYMLQDNEGAGLSQLQGMAGELIHDANAQSGLQGVRTTFRATAPQLLVDIDRDQVKQRGTSLTSVYDTMSVALGSAYVNDYTRFGRVFRVTAQAEEAFRATPDDITALKIRDAKGKMIPMGTVASVSEVLGPQTITRFNQKTSIKIMGSAAPGFSSGESLLIMEDMSDQKLPSSMGYAWTDLSFQERSINPMAMAAVFGFSILMVYLVLSAQYESWSIPISVVLSVPTALLGAVAGLMLRDMTNNIYTQIGIVLLIGLATKSAILIVEFAMVKHDEGMSVLDAAVEAVRLRFRAVMMTAFSFILGVIPLLIASGAGAESRKVLGTTVFFGMLVATAVSLVAVPMMYYIVQSLTNKLSGRPKQLLEPDPMPLDPAIAAERREKKSDHKES